MKCPGCSTTHLITPKIDALMKAVEWRREGQTLLSIRYQLKRELGFTFTLQSLTEWLKGIPSPPPKGPLPFYNVRAGG